MTQEQINKLQELKKLFEAGILTEEEMQQEKKKILATDSPIEKKVLSTKIMIRCSACGEEADSDLAECPHCHEPLSGRSMEVDDSTKPCMFCGQPILSIANKCKHCGKWQEENSEKNKLIDLKKLFDAGVLSEEEMLAEKARILNAPSAQNDSETATKPNAVSSTASKETIIQDTSDSTPYGTADGEEGDGMGKPKYIILAAVALLVIGLIIYAASSSNSPKVTYADTEEFDVTDMNDTEPLNEEEPAKAEAEEAPSPTEDDDEFAFDPWLGSLRIDGSMYRTCDSRCELNIKKVSKGLYTGTIFVMLGSTWPDHEERFDPSLGFLEGTVRAKSDGNVLTVVMDKYTSRVFNPNSDDTNEYFKNDNISGQIFRITYNGGSYTATAIGDMEGYFDAGIEVKK